MAIRFTINGIAFEADTASEALEMARQFSASPSNGAPSEAHIRPKRIAAGVAEMRATEKTGSEVENAPSYEDFYKHLNPNGRRIVAALSKSPEGLTTDPLAEAIGVSSVALPPIIRHVRVAAREAGFGPDTMVTRQAIVDEQERAKSLYVLEEGMRRFIEQRK